MKRTKHVLDDPNPKVNAALWEFKIRKKESKTKPVAKKELTRKEANGREAARKAELQKARDQVKRAGPSSSKQSSAAKATSDGRGPDKGPKPTATPKIPSSADNLRDTRWASQATSSALDRNRPASSSFAGQKPVVVILHLTLRSGS